MDVSSTWIVSIPVLERTRNFIVGKMKRGGGGWVGSRESRDKLR